MTVLHVKTIHTREIVRPLRTTFSTSLGRKQGLHNVIVTVILEDGSLGRGEVPTSIAFREETISIMRRVLAEAGERLKEAAIEDYPDLIAQLRREFSYAPMTISGLETASFRACLSALGIAEHAHWGAARSHLESDITIPFFMERPPVMKWIGRFAKKGFTTYKLKVSGDREKDLHLLSWVYDALQSEVPSFRLRLDGNQGFTTRTLGAFIDECQKRRYEIELIEQPLRKDDFRGFSEVRHTCLIPVILDESVRNLDDARRAIDNNLCDGINIKLAKSGIGESVKILEYAKQNQAKVMIGCMVETMVGLSAAVFLAAGTGLFEYVDLDSVYFLYGENRYPGIRREGAVFLVERDERKVRQEVGRI